MLPRTAEQIRRVLPAFLVAEQMAGWWAAARWSSSPPQLTELRSLAVAAGVTEHRAGPAARGGAGRAGARGGYDQLCALTLRKASSTAWVS